MCFACPRGIYSYVADVQQAIVIGSGVGSSARQAVGFGGDGLALATAKQQGRQHQAQKQKSPATRGVSLMQQGRYGVPEDIFVYIT